MRKRNLVTYLRIGRRRKTRLSIVELDIECTASGKKTGLLTVKYNAWILFNHDGYSSGMSGGLF